MGEHYRHHKKDKNVYFDSIDSSTANEIGVSRVSSVSNISNISKEISIATDSHALSSDHCPDDSCGPCDLCHTIKADPINIEKHGGRLLTVKIKVKNVCYDKKVSVATILYGKYEKILAYKAFTTILFRENGSGKCGIIERTITFVVPDDEAFDPCNLTVRIIANYIYPCE